MTEDRRIEENVPEEKAFRLVNGAYIKNLNELYSALMNADEQVFRHHVNESRNDFGNWVKDVHKDYRLANSIFLAQDREECAKAVRDRLYESEKSAEDGRPQEPKVLLPAPETKKSSGTRSLFDSAMEATRLRNLGLKLRKEKELAGCSDEAPAEVIDADSLEGKKLDEKIDDIEKTVAGILGRSSKRQTSSESVKEDGPSFIVTDPAEELIRFSEEPRFHRQFVSEVSTVFKGTSLKSFASEMKGAFSFRRPNIKMPALKIPKISRPKAESLPKIRLGDDAIRKESPAKQDYDKKEEMLNHLKRVYR